MIDIGADVCVANLTMLSKFRNISLHVVEEMADRKSIVTANNESITIEKSIFVHMYIGNKAYCVKFTCSKLRTYTNCWHELFEKT